MTPIVKTHLSRNISNTPQQIFKTTFLHQMGHQFELIHQNKKNKKEDKNIFDDQSVKCSLFRNRNDVIVTDRIISQSKYLELIDEVGSLLNGNKVIVNASGVEGGLRQKRNGVAVFGVDNGKGNIDYAVNMKYDLSKKNNISVREFFPFYKKLQVLHLIILCKKCSSMRMMITVYPMTMIFTKKSNKECSLYDV